MKWEVKFELFIASWWRSKFQNGHSWHLNMQYIVFQTVSIQLSLSQLWLIFWWSNQCSGFHQVQILSGQFFWNFLPWLIFCGTAHGSHNFFSVESVVYICEGSKFVTTLNELRDCLFSKKENRSLFESNSMTSNLNTGSVVNVTFLVTSHRTEHSLRRSFANPSKRL